MHTISKYISTTQLAGFQPLGPLIFRNHKGVKSKTRVQHAYISLVPRLLPAFQQGYTLIIIDPPCLHVQYICPGGRTQSCACDTVYQPPGLVPLEMSHTSLNLETKDVYS